MASSSEWRERVAQWRASGLSAAQFCAGKDYTTRSLWHWSSRFGQASGARRSPKKSGQPGVPMARLVLDGESVSRGSGSVLVEAHGARVEVRGVVPVETLRGLFEALREPSPGRSQ